MRLTLTLNRSKKWLNLIKIVWFFFSQGKQPKKNQEGTVILDLETKTTCDNII